MVQNGAIAFDPNRALAGMAKAGYPRRIENGFLARFLSGQAILDIGFRGGNSAAVPIVSNAIGVDLDYPGYDGKRLPFENGSQDAVHSSHCLEHIADYKTVLADWYRVLKIGGFLVLMVPHKWLYERKPSPPSLFGGNEHRRFYTPASLLAELEEAWPAGGYRIVHLQDNDTGFNYKVPPEQHSVGGCEIELVAEKVSLSPFADRLTFSPFAKACIAAYVGLIRSILAGTVISEEALRRFGQALPIPPLAVLQAELPGVSRGQFEPILRPTIDQATVDSNWYIQTYPELRGRSEAGEVVDAGHHYQQAGYFEWKLPRPADSIYW